MRCRAPNGTVYAAVDAIKVPDGIALGKKITFHVWATQRGEYVPLLKHFWRAPGTCRANLMCNGARSLRQQGTIFAAATLQPALVEPRSAIAVRVAKRSPAIWQRHSHAKHHCYGARFDAACSHTLWLWLMAALLQTLLLLPSQAPFDLPCSSQRRSWRARWQRARQWWHPRWWRGGSSWPCRARCWAQRLFDCLGGQWRCGRRGNRRIQGRSRRFRGLEEAEACVP